MDSDPCSSRRSPAAVVVDDGAWPDAVADVAELCHRAVAAALAHAPATLQDAELSLLLTDDATVRFLNRRYRGVDRATNVLSFPSLELVPGAPFEPPPGPLVLGDVAVARETVLAEAEAEGKPAAAHLAHLVVHGVLHLLGHDHQDDAEARTMEALETAVLATLGIEDPYAAEAAA